MSTPPPFGDPSNIHRENSSAVGKGVAFGCGGCLMLIGCAVLLFIGIAVFVVNMLRGAEPTEVAFQTAQKSEVIQREIGEPMTLGWFISGSMKDFNGNGTAELSLPITGPNGEVSVHVDAEGKQGRWTYKSMTATIRKTGEHVDLLPLVPLEKRSMPSGESPP
ncbi:MAG: cytochrome c oxidase assembly factor Coa1 family protein [Verrucomicrobiota bacterium]